MSSSQEISQPKPSTGQVHLQLSKISVKEGDQLPKIVLPSTAGRNVDLAVEASKNHLVLFFYPGDGAGKIYSELAGCTPEARSFRDHIGRIRDLGVSVFGVNLHTTERQLQFVEREHLNFELLSDSSKKLTQVLGIPLWVTDEGEEFVSRNTVIVEKGGKVAAVIEKVISEGHVEEVIRKLEQLSISSTSR